MARGPLSSRLEQVRVALADPAQQGAFLQVVGQAWAAAANEEAPVGAPRDTGSADGAQSSPSLKGSIRFEQESPQRGYLVLPRHGLYVEMGTRSHLIQPRAGRLGRNGGPAALRFSTVQGGQPFFRRAVHHPGTRPNPFLERAWQSPRVQEVLRQAAGYLVRRTP